VATKQVILLDDYEEWEQN